MTEKTLERIADVLFHAALSAWTMSLELMKSEVLRDLNEPQVGDYVFETTYPFVQKLRSIGKLVEKPDGRFGTYRIECLDGTIHTWENAGFVKVADEGTLSLLRI